MFSKAKKNWPDVEWILTDIVRPMLTQTGSTVKLSAAIGVLTIYIRLYV